MKSMERCWRGLQLAFLCVLAVNLAGCASRSPAPAVEAGSAPSSPAPPVAPSGSPSWAGFQQQHTAALDLAEQRGLWGQALWHLDVLLALAPADTLLVARQEEALQAARQAVAERKQRARQARTRGEHDLATRLYLEALAAVPEDTEAAEALRGLERERVRRQHLGQLSRNTLMRRPGTEPSSPTSYAAAPAAAAAASDRNELEHASMLASQGEVDGAIAVLQPLIGGRRADPSVRRLLADLYVRQAESMLPARREAAILALERAIQVDPKHPKAASRLKELNAATSPEATKALPTKPPRAAAR